ncbi:MAG: FtsX-like permease family protein [Acidobacteria bacterium]|nr:FtsX-like permease family protein [Acidobacteriota bacterium]
MAIGACFGAMNTMYAAVSSRTREIATLRALGFSRIAVMISFVLESVLLAFAGGIVGCALGVLLVKLALSGVTGTTNFATFSEVVFAFRITPDLLVTGVIFSLVMGFFGGLFPAGRAAFTKITSALRQVG